MKHHKAWAIALTVSLVFNAAFHAVNYAIAEGTTTPEVINETARPDLTLEDLRLDTPDPLVGEQVLFSAKIKNAGDAAISQWTVKKTSTAFEAGYLSIGTYYNAIDPNSYADYTASTPEGNDGNWLSQGGFTIKDDQGAGEYTFTIILDPNNDLDELIETNNTKSITVYVGPNEEVEEDGILDNIEEEEIVETEIEEDVIFEEEPSVNNTLHKIAYWWGKVNQHTKSGEWQTDPDGTSGANINKYDYCKKWYSSTEYAMYNGREHIKGFQNAGNIGYYSATPITYHCTELDVVSDFESQKRLYKNNQQVDLTLASGEELKVEIIASSLREDFDRCGDTRIRFEIGGQYATRFLCTDEYDSITVGNNKLKISLDSIIQGNGVTYAVADIVEIGETDEALGEPSVEHNIDVIENDTSRRERIKDIFRHIRDIKLFSQPKITGKTIEIVTKNGQEYFMYILRGVNFGEHGDVKIGDKWFHEKVLFRSDNLIILIVNPSVRGEIIITRAKQVAEKQDSDRDGLPDEWEDLLGTDPNNPDSDGDGYEDGTEVKYKYDPLNNGYKQLYDEIDLSDVE